MSVTEIVLLGLYLYFAGHTYFILAPRSMKQARASMNGTAPPMHPAHLAVVLLMYGTPLRRIFTTVLYPLVTLAFCLWLFYLLVRRRKQKKGYFVGKEM